MLDGFRLLRDRFDFTAHAIVWHHRFQSRGYPKDLPAPLQPFSDTTLAMVRRVGEILAIADVFDALHRVNSGSGGAALTSAEIEGKMKSAFPDHLDLVASLYTKGVLR